jgi:hypothetical protein
MDEMIAGLERAETSLRREYEYRRNDALWAPSAQRWRDKADGVRYAISIVRGDVKAPSVEALAHEAVWYR